MSWKKVVVMTILGSAAFVYGGDLTVFKLRAALHKNPYGSVTVQHFDAVAQKNGKTQFLFDPPQAEQCVRALFPHEGLPTCWYLGRHQEQGTNI